ncbi:MAG TPA: hypothetical protein VFX98_14060 [Longimicrobiaceae bacterium]|nr:hypothetical protein [Longimicrobiaceae bacterium]
MRPEAAETDPEDRPPTSLDRLRESVAIRVRATSLRAMARQVGMSPTGLEKFIQGGTPYAAGRRKLFEWWGRERGKEGPAAALAALVGDLPAERREPALRALVEALRALYEAQGGCPPWLEALGRRWGSEGEAREGE